MGRLDTRKLVTIPLITILLTTVSQLVQALVGHQQVQEFVLQQYVGLFSLILLDLLVLVKGSTFLFLPR